MEKKEVFRAILWFAGAAVIMTVLGNSACPKIGAAAASFYSSLYAAESPNIGQTAEPEKPQVPESSDQKIVTTSEIGAGTTMTTSTIPVPTMTVVPTPPAEPEPQPQPAVPPESSGSPADTQENVKAPEESPAQEESPAPKEQESVPVSETAQENPPAPKEEMAPAAETAQENPPAEKAPEPPATEAVPHPAVQVPPSAPASPAPAEVPKESPPEKPVKKELSPAEISELEKAMKEGEVREVGEGLAAYKVKKGDTFSQICKKVFGTSASWKEKAEKSNIDPAKIRPGKVLIFKKE